MGEDEPDGFEMSLRGAERKRMIGTYKRVAAHRTVRRYPFICRGKVRIFLIFHSSSTPHNSPNFQQFIYGLYDHYKRVIRRISNTG